jgi:hypothetical protein
MVSTIHRAKGLEFDRVVVAVDANTGVVPGPENDCRAEARLLYVALTRAREDLFRVHLPADHWRVRTDNRTRRWYRAGRQPWQRLGMEVRGSDTDRTQPPGANEPGVDAAATQTRLARACTGDPVDLIRAHDLAGPEGSSPPYRLMHAGAPIGAASDQFRRDLALLLGGSRSTRRRWPVALRGAVIDAVEAVAGDPVIGARAGVGDHGVWLAPRLTGLARLDWNEDGADR